MTSDVADISSTDPHHLGPQQHTCANPRCDEQFSRTLGPGRPKDFHSEDCRRAAERDLRRVKAQRAHHERQAEQLRARERAYVRTAVDDSSTDIEGPTDEQLRRAREAVREMAGMSRFLVNHQGEFADDLLKFYRAVQPVLAPVVKTRAS